MNHIVNRSLYYTVIPAKVVYEIRKQRQRDVADILYSFFWRVSVLRIVKSTTEAERTKKKKKKKKSLIIIIIFKRQLSHGKRHQSYSFVFRKFEKLQKKKKTETFPDIVRRTNATSTTEYATQIQYDIILCAARFFFIPLDISKFLISFSSFYVHFAYDCRTCLIFRRLTFIRVCVCVYVFV